MADEERRIPEWARIVLKGIEGEKDGKQDNDRKRGAEQAEGN